LVVHRLFLHGGTLTENAVPIGDCGPSPVASCAQSIPLYHIAAALRNI
jgi:hypothetical protein